MDLADLGQCSELLLIAVSDRAIPMVAAAVPETEAIVWHASGALLSLSGGFSLHPLKALPPVGEPSDLSGTLLVFEGEHRHTAKLIATAIGARFAEVSRDQKSLYHAAAVFGSNYVAALLDIAERLMESAGVVGTREDLTSLARSALEVWLRHDDERRFTGPAARGDREVMQRHRDALMNQPEVLQIYDLLSAQIAASLLARSK